MEFFNVRKREKKKKKKPKLHRFWALDGKSPIFMVIILLVNFELCKLNLCII